MKLSRITRRPIKPWPFQAALATRGDARFAIATVIWTGPRAPARSSLLTADTVDEAAAILSRLSVRLRGATLIGPLRGGDPTDLLTKWTWVPVPPPLRGARPFADLLAIGRLERRIEAAAFLQQLDPSGPRFAVEGLASALAILTGVDAPAFRRDRAHGAAAARTKAERRP